MINDILDFSKLDAGKVVLDLDRLRSAAAGRGCGRVAGAGGLLQEARSWSAYCLPDVPRTVRGDPDGSVRSCSTSPPTPSSSPPRARWRSASGPSPAADGQVTAPLRGHRHRNRRRRRGPGPALRIVLPGRRVDHPPLRRNRPGIGHLPSPGRGHGRPHRHGERAGRGQRVLVRATASSGQRS